MQPNVIILDGGMGKHLERSGAPFHQPEWSAVALMEAPDAVRQAHIDFIQAGAEVIIANAYAVVPFHLGQDVFSERGRELAALAGRLAREAANGADRPVLVAGTVPPLFGSYEPENFRPDDAPPAFDLLIEAQAPYVDFWIAETVSSIAEAKTIMAAVDRYDPAAELWIAYTVPDDKPGSEVNLRSGETIDAAVAAVQDRADAILINCSPPEAISIALGQIRLALGPNPRGIRMGGYPNAFVAKEEGYAANEVLLDRREELTPEALHAICAKWVAEGATIIGGCCQMYPEHIDALASLRDEA